MKFPLFFCLVPIKFCAQIATTATGRRGKLYVHAAGYQLNKGFVCLVQAPHSQGDRFMYCMLSETLQGRLITKPSFTLKLWGAVVLLSTCFESWCVRISIILYLNKQQSLLHVCACVFLTKAAMLFCVVYHELTVTDHMVLWHLYIYIYITFHIISGV